MSLDLLLTYFAFYVGILSVKELIMIVQGGEGGTLHYIRKKIISPFSSVCDDESYGTVCVGLTKILCQSV